MPSPARSPSSTPGLDFFNTGVELITDKPVSGLPSLDIAQGLASAGVEPADQKREAELRRKGGCLAALPCRSIGG